MNDYEPTIQTMMPSWAYAAGDVCCRAFMWMPTKIATSTIGRSLVFAFTISMYSLVAFALAFVVIWAIHKTEPVIKVGAGQTLSAPFEG